MNKEQTILLGLAVVSRLAFLLYKLASPLALFFLGWLIYKHWSDWYGRVIVIATCLALWSVYRLYHYADGARPGSDSADDIANRLIDRFIAWIGTVKYFTSPYCLVEDPGSYRIKGSDIREILDGDTPLIQPGDILLRGYKGYLDGALIRMTGGGQGAGKYFSHAAFYAGPLNGDADRKQAASELQKWNGSSWVEMPEAEEEAIRNDTAYFQPGPQMVIHSMSRGVHVEDILTFLRCDYLAILRLPDEVRLDATSAAELPQMPENKILEDGALNIANTLAAHGMVAREQAVASARVTALGEIGTGYDFQFDSCHEFHRFSCSEFVYYCYKGVQSYIGLKPKQHTIMGMFARNTITPIDLYEAAANGKLKIIWQNTP